MLAVPSHFLKREFSSACFLHLPYKQRVGGSNPSTPTQFQNPSDHYFVVVFFCFVSASLTNKFDTVGHKTKG